MTKISFVVHSCPGQGYVTLNIGVHRAWESRDYQAATTRTLLEQGPDVEPEPLLRAGGGPMAQQDYSQTHAHRQARQCPVGTAA